MKERKETMMRLSQVSVVLVVLALLPGLAGAAPSYRTTATGTWADGNWSLGTPTTGNGAFIGTGDTSGVATASVDVSGTPATTIALIIGDGVGATDAHGTLNIASGDALTLWYEAQVGRGTSGSTAQINQTGGSLTLEYGGVRLGNNGATGTYDMDAGALSTSTLAADPKPIDVGYDGTGTFDFSGGTVNIDGDLEVAVSANADGTYIQTGDSAMNVTTAVYDSVRYGDVVTAMANNTTASLSVSGDADMIVGNHLNLSDDAGGTTTFTLAGNATLDVGGAIWIGNEGTATLTQTGGTFKTMTRDAWTGFVVGRNSGSTGTYNLKAGTLELDLDNAYSLHVGAHGEGSLNIGDASGTGAITTVGSGAIDLYVRRYASGDGTLRGWTDSNGVALRTLYNAGQVIADGYGTDRSLDLSVMSDATAPSVDGDTNSLENTTDNGWYAQNHGKLLLPDIAIAAGDSSYNWGEAQADAVIDMVNSAKIDFTGLSGSGTFSADLLALDRADVQAAPAGNTFLSYYDLATSGVSYTDFDLTFRYDDSEVADANMLRIYHYVGGEWVTLATSLDATNKLVSAQDITSMSPFAVGYVIGAIPGDADLDGDVDNVDFGALYGSFTGPSGSGMGWSQGDFDGDGDVDNVDFGNLYGNYTGPLGGGMDLQVTPEPAMLSLLGIGAASLLRRRRR